MLELNLHSILVPGEIDAETVPSADPAVTVLTCPTPNQLGKSPKTKTTSAMPVMPLPEPSLANCSSSSPSSWGPPQARPVDRTLLLFWVLVSSVVTEHCITGTKLSCTRCKFFSPHSGPSPEKKKP